MSHIVHPTGRVRLGSNQPLQSDRAVGSRIFGTVVTSYLGTVLWDLTHPERSQLKDPTIVTNIW
jgi:hypothetical protein